MGFKRELPFRKEFLNLSGLPNLGILIILSWQGYIFSYLRQIYNYLRELNSL